MNTITIPDPPEGYKPKRCCECGSRPTRIYGDEPGWKCECGAYATVTETGECNGRTAFEGTHLLRREVLRHVNEIAQAIVDERNVRPWRARNLVYRMAGGIIRRPLTIKYLSEAQARKILDVWEI